MKNIKGEYKVNVIGHGDEDKRGVMRLGGKNGAQIVQDLKSFEWRMSHVKLAKVSLMSCLSGTCGACWLVRGVDLLLRLCIWCVFIVS
jgi:hypothetical protein